MGGSNSKQEVKAKKPELRNFANDEEVRMKAASEKKELALAAYEKQKTMAEERDAQLKKRSKEEKTAALVEQEQALQERIDKAQADMERAMKMREAVAANESASVDQMGGRPVQVMSPPAEKATVQATIKTTVTGSSVVSPRQPQMNRHPGETHMLGMRNEGAHETPISSHSKTADPNQEEMKMQELRRLRAEAKAAEQEKQRRLMQLNMQPEQPTLHEQPRLNQEKPPPGLQQKFDQDSEEEDDEQDQVEDNMSSLRRSMPGDPMVSVAKAQISTIQYAQPVKSPRNIYAADLGNSLNQRVNPLARNQKVIMLGMDEGESGDAEAQRNRNINLQDLQSLLV